MRAIAFNLSQGHPAARTLLLFLALFFSTVVASAQTDIQVTGAVSDATPDELQNITYTWSVKNNGPVNATAVNVLALLPANMTFISATPSAGTYTSGTGVWAVGGIANGITRTLSIVARPNTGTNGLPITFTCSYQSSTPSDNNSSNNVASVPVLVNFPNIAITKTATAGPYREGQNLTYTVTVTNNGPMAATGVRVKDLLPPTLNFVSATATQGIYNSGTGLWTVGSLAAAVSRTLTLVASPATGSSGTYVSNVASLDTMNQRDPAILNNSGEFVIFVAQPTVNVTMAVSDATPDQLQSITYTLTAANPGQANATNVVITDTLPVGLNFGSFTTIPAGSTATYNPANRTITYTHATLNMAVTRSLVFTVTVANNTAATTIVNKAQVASMTQPNSQLANPSATNTLVVNGADLEVTKTVNNPNPAPGNTVIFTINVRNNGPLLANDVKIYDTIPAGLTFVSATATEGSYVLGTFLWGGANNLDLAVGETRTLTITCTVNAGASGAIVNTAGVNFSSAADGIAVNNTAAAALTIGGANIGLTKTAPFNSYAVGDTVTYTLTVTNAGPNPAAGFSVKDTLPVGLTLVSASTSFGSFNPATMQWSSLSSVLPATVGSNTAVLTLLARVDEGTAGQALNNRAFITTLQSGNSTANDTANKLIQVKGADLQLTQSISTTTPTNLQDFYYTLTLTNLGPDTATGIQVGDTLPNGLRFLTAVPSQGSFNNGIWSGITLASGQTATLQLNVRFEEPRTVTNRAYIIASSQPDGNTANNSTSLLTTGYKTFGAGAAIINMGITPQTVNNGLRPYGLIYQLVRTVKVPVYWCIKPNKSFVTPLSKTDQIDQTINGVDYRSGFFVIPEEFMPMAQSTI